MIWENVTLEEIALPGLFSSLIDGEQADVLTERYWEILLGNPGSVLLLIAQAPLIGGLVALRWQGASPTPGLYFILCLTSVWCGCVNSCREIVKERPVFERERHHDLQIPAYVWSKLRVQAVLGAIQSLLLLWVVHFYVGIPGSKVLHALALFLSSMAGISLGLAVSAFANSTDSAVGLVPIVVIPQILFSKFILKGEFMKGTARHLEKLMIVGWGNGMVEEILRLSSDPHYLELLKNGIALTAFTAGLAGIAMALLRHREI